VADTPLRPDADPSWRELHALARTFEPAVRDLFLTAIAALTNADVAAAILRALTLNDPTTALHAIPTETLAPTLAELSAVLESLATDASRLARGRLLGMHLPAGVTAEIAVGLGTMPVLPTAEIAQWARTYAASLAQDLSDETVRALRSIVGAAVESGQSPARMAKLIEQIVGLNRRQAAALARYRQALVEDGVATWKVERLTGRYAARLLKQRAIAIARSETIAAANMGNLETWRRNVREGVLDPERWVREWLAIGDPRTCPDCEALDGQRAPIGQPFISPTYGEVWAPALHTNCRCLVALVRA